MEAEENRRKRRTRVLVLVSIAALASMSLVSGGLSLALFTSQQTVPGNAFTTGTLVLGTSPTSALITFSAMAPGDATTAALTVSNTGTLALRYSATSQATDADSKGLAAELVLTVKSGVTTCTNGGYTADGTVLFSGVLGAVAPAFTQLFGDSTPGDDTGDRPLAASDDEVLCFHAALPIGAGDAYQGATTTATFTFDAEQTKNN